MSTSRHLANEKKKVKKKTNSKTSGRRPKTNNTKDNYITMTVLSSVLYRFCARNTYNRAHSFLATNVNSCGELARLFPFSSLPSLAIRYILDVSLSIYHHLYIYPPRLKSDCFCSSSLVFLKRDH